MILKALMFDRNFLVLLRLVSPILSVLPHAIETAHY